MSRDTHRVAVLVLPGALPLDVAIPIQTFTAPDYEVVAVGENAVVAAAGVGFDGLAPLTAMTAADTVVVPGYADWGRVPSDAVLRALRDAHARGTRIASICTGAFALAAAGLLDRRPATTHWQAINDLRSRYPSVRVQPSLLYVDDGDVLTSAGVLAGVDLCLHLVRSDQGAAAANTRARALVASPRRLGNQSAYNDQLTPRADDDAIAALCGRLLESLGERRTVDEMAGSVHMSRRTFIRRFTDATGTPPHMWLTLARLDAARELLERTDDTVDAIGHRTGLGSPAAFRATFQRHLSTSPSAYRRAFATRP